MSRTKTFWRFFLAYQDQAQEAWLESQALRGWHLSKPGIFRYTFVQGESREDRYRMDYETLRGKRRAEYLTLFDDAGWDFLGEAINRYYFRARPNAFSPEVLSDPESRRARMRRELGLLGGVLAIAGWNTSISGAMVLSGHGFPREWILPIAVLVCALGVFTALTGWCVWKLARAMRHS